MKFSQYTWNLYKQSPNGQKAIKEFEDASNEVSEIDIVFKYNEKESIFRDASKLFIWR